MLSINDITGYAKAIVRVIVPDIVPASDQKRLRNAAKSAPPSDSTKATVFLLNRCLSAASCENRFSANARWFESLTPRGLQRKTIPRQRAGDNPSVAPKAPTTSTLGVFLMDTSRFQSV